MTKVFSRHFSIVLRMIALIGLLLSTVLGPSLSTPLVVQAANPDGNLKIEIITAYNFIVDSNVTTPATHAPKSATIGAKVCNTGATDMTGVTAYVGDFKGTVATSTPGTYPVRDSNTDLVFQATSPHLANSGNYSLTHEGGSAGKGDATRYIGSLPAGACRVEYWLVSYPRLKNGDSTQSVTGGIKPGDDLWLDYDIWAAGSEGATARLADVTRRATMRNEISAAANKIWPQTTSKVPNDYLTAIQTAFGWNTIVPGGGSTAYPGDTLVTRGIWYDFGNIGAGFDNDGNLIPDRNAWVQPVGDPDAYDPGCFRLVRTYGIVVVKLGGGGEFLIPFENQLYFSELPGDNTGAVGLVYYEYVALDGACRGVMSPYQEVASGFDNEKFNADFGAGIPPLQTTEAVMTFDKNGDTSVNAGGTVTYSMIYNNVDPDAGGPLTVTVGDPALGTPFGVYDKVPTGTCYVPGSATAVAPTDANNLLIDGVQNAAAYLVLYSIDTNPADGIIWQTTEPGDADANSCNDTTYLKWTRVEAVANGSTGRVNFKVTVPSTYVTTQKTAIVENTGCIKLGDGNCFKDDTHITIVSGSRNLSGTVYQDTGTGGGVLANGVKDGTEPGIYGADGVTVTLYYWNDKDSDNIVDAGELTQIKTTQTSASGAYLFDLLPAGKYITKVSTGDSDIPTGYGITTPDQRAATLVAADITGLDFGFAPPLKIAKRRDSPASVRVGDIVNYTISVSNVLPGGGDSSTACKYNLWASSEGSLSSGETAGKRFHNDFAGNPPTNAFNAAGPDNLYAFTDYATSGSQIIDSAGIATGDQGGTIQSVKARVKYYLDTPLTDDTGTVTLYVGAGAGTVNDTLTLTTAQLNAHVGAANAGWLEGAAKTTKLVGTVSSAWTWADLAPGAANPVHVVYENSKTTSGDRVFLYIDAMAVQVTTDQVCGGANTILNPVPLTDTFVTNDLAFVSANPPISGPATPSGANTILTWDNVGPLYPGQTKTITVSFTASQVIAGSTDTATSTNTKFANGVNANSPVSATASVAITAASTRSLTGTIFDDNNPANGWSGSAWTQAGAMTGMDAGDTGIANVPVDLYACVDQITGALITSQNKTCYAATGTWVLVRSTTTNASGVYTFSNLTLGVYYAKVHTASIPGSQVADVNLAGVCGASCDSLSNNPIADNLNAFVGNLDANTSVTRVNFGYNVGNGTASTIGDTLYYDWNGNGTQDPATEETLKDVTVRLYNAAGGLVATDTDSDHNGQYLFSGLAAGVYTVKVDTTDTQFPAGLVVETQDPDESGTCVTCDSSASSTVDGTASDLTRDFGYKPTGNTGQIGDTVWKDVDGDGAQLGSNETGLSGVKVLLQVDLNGDGTYVTLQSMTTDATGKYLFDRLPVGTQFNYRVVIDMSDSINTTAIPTDGLGNNYTPTTGTTSGSLIYRNVTLTSAAPVDLTADFGFTALAAIGNTIFWDVNANGQQDWSEKGIPGVTVMLYLDVNDDGIADAGEIITDKCATGLNPCVTDANGKYLFSKLPASTHKYLVVVDTTSTPLVGKLLTADPDNDGAACSGVAGVCDNQTTQRLYAGTLFTGANFGYQPTNVIGDTVWADTNQNGIQDLDASGNPTETGLADVTVRLYNDVNSNNQYDAGTDTLVSSTTTDISGQYLFSGLADGNYVVVVDPATLPSGYVQSADPTVPGVPCRGLPTCNNEGAATLAGNSVLTEDFGYVLYGDYSISGTICKDNSAEDGICTGAAGEQALLGRPVNLYRLNGGVTEFVRTVSTDASGNYLFPNLPNGSYFVSTDTVQLFDKPRLTTGAPAVAVSDANSNLLGGYRPVTIASASVADQDFAFVSDAILDFGDLPATYNTLLSANPGGPRHIIPGTPNLYLGATPPDAEADGQPGILGAKNDDNNGPAGNTEESGIALNLDASYKWILSCTITDCQGNINVTSTVPTGGGWVIGWMDFNEDGDFTDSGEMIVSQAVSTTGTQTLSVTAPLGAQTLTNYIYRFRLFSSEPMIPELSFTGSASNGEVEDYIWKAGTTAVSLMKFTASSSLPTLVLPLAAIALLALGLALLLRRK
jgi:hypothetical protein